tara:strand:+ start:29 stop:244 length:216 start_codon:yes stop_codon:yes gene_type:complete
MIDYKVFSSKEDIEQYLNNFWFEDAIREEFPTEFPCLGFAHKIEDGPYDIQFISSEDVAKMASDLEAAKDR